MNKREWYWFTSLLTIIIGLQLDSLFLIILCLILISFVLFIDISEMIIKRKLKKILNKK